MSRVRTSTGIVLLLALLCLTPAAAETSSATAPLSSSTLAASGSCAQGTIALTFDAGPSMQYTQGIMHILERANVPATFFMLGDKVDQHPSLARWVSQSGFTVGNHTFDHADLTQLSPGQAREEVVKAFRSFRHAGVEPWASTRFVRLPFGRQDAAVDAMLNRGGWRPVGWGVSARDGNPDATPQSIEESARRGLEALAAQPGAVHKVMLLHDGAERADFRNYTGEALPQILDDARDLGFCFTTLRRDGHADTTAVTLSTENALLRAKIRSRARGDGGVTSARTASPRPRHH